MGISSTAPVTYAIDHKGRYPALGHPLPWVISFFLNEKKINIFRLMHIALFLKLTY